eukprot:EG_transcript_48536
MLEVTCLDGDDEDSRVWLTASGPPRPAEQLLTLYVVAEAAVTSAELTSISIAPADCGAADAPDALCQPEGPQPTWTWASVSPRAMQQCSPECWFAEVPLPGDGVPGWTTTDPANGDILPPSVTVQLNLQF